MTNAAYSYDQIGASALIKNNAGVLGGFLCTAGTNPTIEFYDNTAASGIVVISTMPMTVGTPVNFNGGIQFGKGIYAVIGGTGVEVTVWYR